MSLDAERDLDKRLAESPYHQIINKRNKLEQNLRDGRNITVLEGDDGVPQVYDTKQFYKGVAKCASSVYMDAAFPSNTRRELARIRLGSDMRALGKIVRRGLSFSSRLLRAMEKALPED